MIATDSGAGTPITSPSTTAAAAQPSTESTTTTASTTTAANTSQEAAGSSENVDQVTQALEEVEIDPNTTLTVRALVSTKEAGVIIGKSGHNVAELREKTGVKAGVSKVVPGVHDRVLSVSGTLEGIAKVSISIAMERDWRVRNEKKWRRNFEKKKVMTPSSSGNALYAL